MLAVLNAHVEDVLQSLVIVQAKALADRLEALWTERALRVQEHDFPARIVGVRPRKLCGDALLRRDPRNEGGCVFAKQGARQTYEGVTHLRLARARDAVNLCHRLRLKAPAQKGVDWKGPRIRNIELGHGHRTDSTPNGRSPAFKPPPRTLAAAC